MTDDAGQVLPRTGPVERALLRMQKRLTLLQEEIDAAIALANALDKRLDALQEAFYRHSHPSNDLEGVLALNAAESRQERERHDG